MAMLTVNDHLGSCVVGLPPSTESTEWQLHARNLSNAAV